MLNRLKATLGQLLLTIWYWILVKLSIYIKFMKSKKVNIKVSTFVWLIPWRVVSGILTWTVILANAKLEGDNNSSKFSSSLAPSTDYSFTIELCNKTDSRFSLVHQYPVHSEDSEEVLNEGYCVKVSMNEVKRFVDFEQVRMLHFNAPIPKRNVFLSVPWEFHYLI